MSELLDKQDNVQKEKSFQGSHKLLQAHKKVCNIMPKQKTGENDLHELLRNDYGYNEGTICVVNR